MVSVSAKKVQKKISCLCTFKHIVSDSATNPGLVKQSAGFRHMVWDSDTNPELLKQGAGFRQVVWDSDTNPELLK